VASLALALLLLASCGGTGPHTLSWPADRTVAASRGEKIRNWPQAVAAIVTVMEGPLGLPPVEFSVSFFPNRSAFEAGLVAEGYPAAVAARVAAALDGVGIPRRVLLNERSLARVTWADRVAMLSHELVHVLQYELARGRRGTSEQWLREGFAEWVSGRVLEGLHLSGAGSKRGRARRAVAVAGPSRLPALAELATWDQWVELRTTSPRLPVYPYAFLAADLLVERHGVDAVLDYFRRFAVSNDADGAFRFAFGETRGEFEAEFRATLGP
jgi:hypothetical protein